MKSLQARHFRCHGFVQCAVLVQRNQPRSQVAGGRGRHQHVLNRKIVASSGHGATKRGRHIVLVKRRQLLDKIARVCQLLLNRRQSDRLERERVTQHFTNGLDARGRFRQLLDQGQIIDIKRAERIEQTLQDWHGGLQIALVVGLERIERLRTGGSPGAECMTRSEDTESTCAKMRK